MQPTSQLPQYTFDPVTQRYTLKTPAEQSRSRNGLGGLYDATGGGEGMAPGVPGNPTVGSSGVLGGLGQTLSGIPTMGTQVVGGLLANQAINQNAKTDQALAQMQQQAIPSVVTMGPFGPVAAPAYDVTISPVAAPVAPVETAIAPTVGLAAMNAQQAAQQNEVANQAAVANTAVATADAVSNAAASPGVATDTSAAPSVSDAGGSAMGDSGAGIGSVGGDSTATGGSDSSTTGSGASDTGAAEGGWRRGGQVMNYEQGGLASAAKHIQSQGRGDDSVLVHMTPKEVRGLQAIAMAHGGSLTINPETGLIEAGFLESILPMIAGAALAPFTGGASMAALLVGGGTALMTGSLEKGLMAGLGAFGGAGLAGSLSAAGAASTAGQAMTPQLAQAATITPQAATTGGAKFLEAAGTQMVPQGAATLIPGTSQAALQAAAAGAPAAPITYGNMGTGLSQIIQGNPSARNVFMKDIGGISGLGLKVGAPLAAGMFSAEEPDTGGKKPQEYIRPYSFDFKPSAETDPNFRFRTGAPGESTAEQRYFTPTFTPMGVFKGGTEPGPSFYGTPTAEQYALYSRPKDQNILGLAAGGMTGLGRGGLKDGAFVVPADVVSHLGNGSNDAGQKILARGLGARPIKGKGDGMSDSIATSIEGRQPARVADGEAYIPPQVVKKVGSKRLYDMMAKIRQARTGTKKQAPEVNPRQFMPA